MSINWFTVVAQLINFLILVWLLKRFLYKPILNAVKEREKKITDQIEDAEKKEMLAEKESMEFRKKNEEFDQQKSAMMNKAVSEIADERQKLLDDARSEANALREKLKTAAVAEQERYFHEISQKTQSKIFDIIKKTLKELADSDLEQRIVKIFIQKLKSLDENEKAKVLSSGANAQLIVKSAFELTKTQKEEISESIHQLTGKPAEVHFELSDYLISGIELNVRGYKLAWNISEYLSSLEAFIKKISQDNTESATVK